MINPTIVEVINRQEAYYCDLCAQPMQLAKDFGSKPRGTKRTAYRVRRFECTLCDFQKTIFANGSIDDQLN